MLSVANKPFMLSDIMPNVIMLILLIVTNKPFMLSDIMLSIDMKGVIYSECHYAGCNLCRVSQINSLWLVSLC